MRIFTGNSIITRKKYCNIKWENTLPKVKKVVIIRAVHAENIANMKLKKNS